MLSVNKGTNSTEELDVIDYWDNIIDRHVQNGAKLREEKYKSRIEPRAYKVVDVKYGSFTKNKYKKTRKYRKTKNGNGSVRGNRYFTTQTNHRPKCPLRVAELAVPSKRRCLDNWRNRSNTLPYIMVDRLKQIVLDDKPMVRVSDAINCFKRRKRKLKSVKCNDVKNNKRLGMYKCFLGIFIWKIIEQLEKPAIIKLNPHLQRISDIVAADVADILHNRSEVGCSNKYNEYQEEVVKKVTVWIENILEESSYNILLNDFKELEEEEGHIWEFLDTLVENVVVRCENNHYVLQMSTKSQSSIESSDQSDSNEFEDSKDFSTYDSTSHFIESIVSDLLESADTDSTHTYMNAILNVLINNVAQIPDNNYTLALSNNEKLEKTNDHNPFIIGINNKEIEEKNEQIPIITTIHNNNLQEIDKENNEINKNAHDETYTVDVDDNELGVNFAREKNKETVMDTNDTSENNKYLIRDSKVFFHNLVNDNANNTIENEDHTTADDDFKKVKFSNINIDKQHPMNKIKRDNKINNNTFPTQIRQLVVGTEDEDSDKITKTILISEPNLYLLSDADENWPENLTLPITKSLSSIIKSVTSLGWIAEMDEHSSPSSKRISKNSINIKPNENSMEIIDVDNIPWNNYDSVGYEERSLPNNINECIVKVDLGKPAPTNVTNTFHNNSLSIRHLSNLNITPEIHTRSTAAELKEIETQIDQKTYRHKRTQVELTISNKENQLAVQKNQTLYLNGYRDWCEGLLNLTDNLETWSIWLHNVTAQIYNLSNTDENRKIGHSNKGCDRKYNTTIHWFKLKEDIDADAKLWGQFRGKTVKSSKPHQTFDLKVMPNKCNCNKKHHYSRI